MSNRINNAYTANTFNNFTKTVKEIREETRQALIIANSPVSVGDEVKVPSPCASNPNFKRLGVVTAIRTYTRTSDGYFSLHYYVRYINNGKPAKSTRKVSKVYAIKEKVCKFAVVA